MKSRWNGRWSRFQAIESAPVSESLFKIWPQEHAMRGASTVPKRLSPLFLSFSRRGKAARESQKRKPEAPASQCARAGPEKEGEKA